MTDDHNNNNGNPPGELHIGAEPPKNNEGEIHIDATPEPSREIHIEAKPQGESGGIHIDAKPQEPTSGGIHIDAETPAKIEGGIHIDATPASSGEIHIEAKPQGESGGIHIDAKPQEPTSGGIHIDAKPTSIPQGIRMDSAPQKPAPKPAPSPSPEQENHVQSEKPLPSYTGPRTIIGLLDYARDHFGSDLHIAADRQPKMRLFGEVREIPGAEPLTEEETMNMIHDTMAKDAQEEYKETSDVDYSYCDEKKNRYRCNAMMTLHGPAAVFRIISNKILTFEELGLPESVLRIKDYKKGLVLVTGPSGCGKSTTLASFVDMVNEIDDGHILTIEDPVEILHKSKKSLVNHREVKTHTKSFARALKSALREDPDCIMIGEMRDHETISLALTAAETGHLVFGTLHTSSAVKTISRIIDVFPANEQDQVRTMLAESIQCVISQVLCKKKNGDGQVAAFEIMFGTPGIRSLVRSKKEFQIPSTIEVGMKEGMNTLDQHLHKLIKQGIVDKEDIIKYATRPEDF